MLMQPVYGRERRTRKGSSGGWLVAALVLVFPSLLSVVVVAVTFHATTWSGPRERWQAWSQSSGSRHPVHNL